MADESWLKDSERVYPVYIDPTTKVQASQDASVSEAYPNANYGSDWDAGLGAYILKAGNYSSATGENFAYIQTPTPSLPNATIETAIFNIYNVHSYYPSTLTGIWLDRVNGPWDESTIKWSNKPTSSLFTSTSVHKGKWATFNVKNAVNDWMKGTTPNNGFKMHTNGNGQTFWKKFYSSEHSVADYRPHLNIAYFYTSPSNLAAETTSLGDGTGYIDLQWNAVAGASSYNVWIFDGKEYKSINVGKNTKWSTKDKSVWPQVGANLPVNPQAVYRASGGTTYNDRTNYAISVSAVFANGESPNANPIVPSIPNLTMPKAPSGVAYSNQVGTNSGYVNLKWEPINGATGYKVWIFNGLSYEAFDVKDATNWTTQNKGIWPTAEEIKSGDSETLKLHQDGKGLELPADPSPMYSKMGTKYENSKEYWFRVSAYNGYGETVFSNDTFNTKIPSSELMGYENYWPTLETPAGTVNAINGNLTFNEIDAIFDGRGPVIQVSRTYNSSSSQTGSFGRGWLFSYDIKLKELANKDVLLIDEDGTSHQYKYESEGVYSQPHGLYLPIQKVGDNFIITTKNQEKMYFTDGRLTKIEDVYREENSINLEWTSEQLDITDASNRKIKVTFVNNRISQIEDYSGRVWKYSYIGDLLTSYQDPEGSLYSYFYTNGRMNVIKDAKGNELTIGYDKLNRIDTVKEYNGNITTISYAANQISIISPSTETTESSTDTLSYNVEGNPDTLITDSGVGGLNLTTRYNYYNNELIDTVDEDGNESENTYDNNGNLLTNKDVNGNLTTYTYNSSNQPLTLTNKEGITSYTYSSLGDLISIIDPGGEITQYEYDQYGNLITMILADGTQESYSYSTDGNYLKGVTDSLGRITKTERDKFGNTSSVTDPMLNSTIYSYDSRNLLTGLTDAKGNITNYEYDANGNLTLITNSLNQAVTLSYNSEDQIDSRIEPSGQKTTIQYDANGNITQVKMPNSQIIQYAYNSYNQLTSEAVNGAKYWSYSYDQELNTTTIKNEVNGFTKTLFYDENDNLVKKVGGTQSIQYVYGESNNLESIIGTSNDTLFTQSYKNDSQGRLTEISQNGLIDISLEYTKASMLASYSYANGVQGEYVYDNAQQLTSLSVKNDKEIILAENYKHDKNGNIINFTTSFGTSSYTYDVINQLTSQTLPEQTVETFQYDAVGNRTKMIQTQNENSIETEYTYNANNQLTSVNDEIYFYDANGNRTKDNLFIYEYNQLDQLVEIETLSGQTIATYAYDEEGRRISKTANGSTINYHYNQGINVMFETDSSGDILANYSYDKNGFPLTMTKNGEIYYYILDGHKNVVALTDSTGKTVASYSYDAWGNILTQNGEMAEENTLRYKGYHYDEETKFYYLMSRYYQPKEGVFLAADSVGGDTGNYITQHGYIYANNNPVMMIDPNGTYAWILKEIAKYALKTAIRNPKNLKLISQSISSFIRKSYVKKALKKSGYKVETNLKKGYILKVYDKNKRVLSIDYHSLTAFKMKGVDTKKYPIFHIHLGNDKTHYIPKSMIPKGFKIKNDYLNNKKYIWISEFLF